MDTTTVAVLVLVALGVVMLVATAGRQRRADIADPRADRARSLGMSIGMLVGASLGVIVWILTGEYVFWVVFLGGGLAVGLAAGQGIAGRSR